jgi:hypothetical protein
VESSASSIHSISNTGRRSRLPKRESLVMRMSRSAPCRSNDSARPAEIVSRRSRRATDRGAKSALARMNALPKRAVSTTQLLPVELSSEKSCGLRTTRRYRAPVSGDRQWGRSACRCFRRAGFRRNLGFLSDDLRHGR